ncbi:MAG TPA: hypothetical protein VNX01_15170 [Bacteroidia bacterium]|nr:hypothetical protein [Bacteroidia bacterium]
MKIINNLVGAAVILLGLCFTTTSCAKKPTPTPAPAPVSPAPTYTFNAMGVTATGVQYSISSQTQSLQITGSNASANNNGNEQTITITINNAVNSVGSYTLSATNNNTGVYTSGSNTFRYSTGNSPYVGTLNITKYDATNRVMSVSFNFDALETFPTAGSQHGTIYGSFDNISF